MDSVEIFNKAVSDLETGKLVEAESGFNFLLDHDPNSPEILFYVATCMMQRGFLALTEHLLKLALANNPKENNALAAIWNNIGYVYKHQLRDKEAIEAFNKAIEYYPGDADMYNNIGSMLVNNGTPMDAIYYFDKALKINPDHHQSHWNRSLAYLEAGRWKEGWADYEWGYYGDGKRKDKQYIDGNLPIWDGKNGKKIVVYGEQGIGDEIMFSSMLNDLAKNNEIIYDAHPRLANIARNSFDFPVYGTRKEHDPDWVKLENPDCRLAIGSLGQHFRKKASDFPKTPYLKADQSLVKKYKEKLDSLSDKPKIGISWKGGYKVTRKDLRSISLDNWGDILDIDADFISLQYTPNADKEIAEAEKQFGIKIHHWQDAIDDYDETAALVSNLDLVISVCTSVIHLSGALGVECWVLTPSRPAWRYGVKGKMPWYDSVKLYRQKDTDWDSVFKQVKGDLCHLFQKTIAA